jgi:hypothetical protein
VFSQKKQPLATYPTRLVIAAGPGKKVDNFSNPVHVCLIDRFFAFATTVKKKIGRPKKNIWVTQGPKRGTQASPPA